MKKRADTDNESDLDEPEEALWSGTFSALSMIGAWIAAGLLTVVLLGGLGFSPWRDEQTVWWIAGAILAALWVWLIGTLLYRKFSRHYDLTTQRLKHRKGILFRKMNRIELIDIDDVMYEQGPIQAMLGVGTITLKTTDTSDPDFDMIGIADVKHISELIDDARRKERRLRGLHIETI